MTSIRYAALAIAIAAALPGAAHATGDPAPEGRTCDFLTANAGEHTADSFTGQVNGGPLVAAGHSISLRCSVHVGNAVHSGPAVAEASAGPSDHVVALPPTQITFQVDPEWEDVVLCTEATVDTTTWYWTDGQWSTDADGRCDGPERLCCPPEVPPALRDLPEPVRSLVGYAWCFAFGDLCDVVVVLDVVSCPVFQALAPGVPGLVDIDEEGDIFLNGEWFWDCPPYDIWV